MHRRVTASVKPKATRIRKSETFHFVPGSTINFRNSMKAKNMMHNNPHEKSANPRSDLIMMKDMSSNYKKEKDKDIPNITNNKPANNAHNDSNQKKDHIKNKLKNYNTIRLQGKPLTNIDRVIQKTDLYQRNKVAERPEPSDDFIPINLLFSANGSKKLHISALKCFQVEGMLEKIQQYLTYSEFYYFMLSSKSIYNKQLIINGQVKLIMQGLNKTQREKLWKDKCKIVNDESDYDYYCIAPTDCDGDIEKDITRTFPESHIFCRNEENYKKLTRILHAFAVRHPEIGYIQGLNYLAGNLILLFPEGVIYQLIFSLPFGHSKDFV